MSTQQRWGIWPTHSFWRDPTLSRRLRWSIHLIFAVQAAVGVALLLFGPWHLSFEAKLVYGLAGALLETLEYGLAERVLRRHILARRRRYELAAAVDE